MKTNIACGLLMCRWTENELEFFLVHPGGPFFKNKQQGVWSIPKGLPEGNEEFLVTAKREFTEETGLQSMPPFYELQPVKQKSGKIVHAWTFIGDWEPEHGIVSNMFEMEWPKGSGKMRSFPEQDSAAWMKLETAMNAINIGQVPLLHQALDIHTKNR